MDNFKWEDFEPAQPTESKPDQETTNWDDFEPVQWNDFEPVKATQAAPAAQQAPTSADPVPADTLGEAFEKKVVNTADRWKGIGGGLISMAGDDKGALESIAKPFFEAEQEGRDPGFFDYYKSAFNAVTSGTLLSSLQKQAIDKDSVGGKFLSSMSKTGRKITEDANKELAANRVETDSLGVELASDIVGGTIDMLPMLIAGRIGGPSAAGTVFGGQVAGHTYGSSVGEKGRTQGEALNAVKFDMLAEWIPEKFMVIDTLLKPGTSFIKRTINATLGEGAQEALTEVLQSAYDDVTLKDMSVKEAIMNLDWERVAKASAIGAGVGFSLAGPAHVLDKIGRPTEYDQKPGEPITPTHKVSGGVDAQPVTKNGKPVPGTFIDATGKIHKDNSAVEQPIIKPSRFDVGPLDVNASMEAIKAEVMGGETGPAARQGIIDSIYGVDDKRPPPPPAGVGVLKDEPAPEFIEAISKEKDERIAEIEREAITPTTEQLAAGEEMAVKPPTFTEQQETLTKLVESEGLESKDVSNQYVIDKLFGDTPAELIDHAKVNRLTQSAKAQQEINRLEAQLYEPDKRATEAEYAETEPFEKEPVTVSKKPLQNIVKLKSIRARLNKQRKEAEVKPAELLGTIANKGGINRQFAEGIDPAEMNIRKGGIRPVFPVSGGMSMDEMGELLFDEGFFQNERPEANEVIDLVNQAMAGEDVYRLEDTVAKAESDYEAELIDRQIADIDTLIEESTTYQQILKDKGLAPAEKHLEELQIGKQQEVEAVSRYSYEYLEQEAGELDLDQEGKTYLELMEQAEKVDPDGYEAVIDGLIDSDAEMSVVASEMLKLIEGKKDEAKPEKTEEQAVVSGEVTTPEEQAVEKPDRRKQRQQVEDEQRTGADRRKDQLAREKIKAMPREELEKLVLEHDLTGVKSRFAFDIEHKEADAFASIDADSLKWVNDNMTPDNGDKLLQAVADALVGEFGYDRVYHISGDEFYVLGFSDVDSSILQEGMSRVDERLSRVKLKVSKDDGTKIELKGIAATAGHSDSKLGADNELKKLKESKEEAGERAKRGEPATGAVITTPEGKPDRQDRVAGDEGQAGEVQIDTGTKEEVKPNWTGSVNGQDIEVNISPSEDQIEAGNYLKGSINVQGLKVSIETPMGVKRAPAYPPMAAHYGYIKDTIGADSETGAAPHEIEQVDIFVADVEIIPDDSSVFIINQYLDGKFDEVKTIAGAKNEADARKMYLDSYTKGWKGLNSIHELSIEEFKSWLDTGDMMAEYHPVENKGDDVVKKLDIDQEKPVETEPEKPVEAVIEPVLDEDAAKSILNAANVTGTDRLDVMSKFRDGTYSLDDLRSAYPADVTVSEPVEEPEKIDVDQVSEPIEDVGEKIGGARKDVWSGFREKISDEVSSDDILSQPLSKLFPEPDYAALAENGANTEALAIIKVMRDEIPAKGRSSYKRKQYVNGVKLFQDTADDILNKPGHRKTFIDGLRENRALSDLADRVDLMLELGFPANKDVKLKGITLKKVYFSLYNGEKDVAKWVVDNHVKSKRTMGGMGGQVAAVDTREEAVAALKEYLAVEGGKPKGKRVTKFEVYKYRRDDGRGWIVGKKLSTRNQYDMKTGFKTSKEARLYADTHQTELENQLKKYKEIPSHRKEFNDSRLGDDYRGGKDVAAEEFRDTFGFRGVEFGNWVEQKKRQVDINEAYDGLMDLAKLLGLPPKALSLNSELGLAFGARGAGGKLAPKAHYEPGKIVINLTKKDGAGSLAHEWFHSLDNYFSRMRGDKTSYLTDRPFELMDKSVRKEMIDSFRGVVDAIKATDLPKRAAELDKHRAKPYWATTIEMAARSFESYIVGKLKDKELSNDYLANIVSEEYWEAAENLGLEDVDSYPYILADELKSINTAFDKFFDVVETKETDKGVMLFSADSQIKRKPLVSIPRANLDAVVERFREQYKGAVAVNIIIRDTQEAAFGAGSVEEHGRIKGGFYPGTNDIVLVAENITNNRDAMTTLRHEIVSHYGLRQLLNKDGEYDALLDRVDAARDGELKDVYEAVEKAYPEVSDKHQLADEVLAKVEEARKKSSFIDRIYARIIKLLHKFGLMTGPISRKEVNALLELSAQNLRQGFVPVTGPTGEVVYQRDGGKKDQLSSVFYHGTGDLSGGAINKFVPYLHDEMAVVSISITADPKIASDYAEKERMDSRDSRNMPHVYPIRVRGEIVDYLDVVDDIESKGIPTSELVDGVWNSNKFVEYLEERNIGALDIGFGLPGELIVLNPDRIVSAIERVYRKVEDEPVGSTLGMPEETKFQQAQRYFQDAFNRVGQLQETIKQEGGTVTYESDVYLAEELASGKTTARLTALDKEHMRPLLDQMAADDITIEELDEFLRARHAPERNDYIASINEDMQDGGSGMTYMEADAIMARLEDKRPALERAAEKVYAVNNLHSATLVGAGHIDAETVGEWQDRWQFYVPLKGKVEEETGISNKRGQGYSVSGSGVKAAMGRGAGNMSESPTAHAFAQAESAIVRAEKTKIGQALVQLVRDNPDPAFWSISKRTMKRFTDIYGEPFEGYDEAPEGLVQGLDFHRVRHVTKAERALAKEEGRNPVAKVAYKLDQAYKQRDDVFAVMVEGQELLIKVNDNVVAEQLKRLNASQFNWLVSHAGMVNRYLAMVNTALNPQFVVTNFERDFQTAMIHLSGEQSTAMAWKVLKSIPAAGRGIWQGTFDTGGQSQWRTDYEEMQAEGGTIGFFGLEDIDAKIRRIQGRLDNRKTAFGTVKKGLFNMRDVILDANLAVENSARLAAYVAVRDSWIANGMPVKEARAKAASIAKNLTVNFNRKGELGPIINSFYLFYNAAIQGPARIITSLAKSKRTRQIVAGMVAVGFVQAMFNRSFGGDDDDDIPKWDKISNYDKQNHMIFMVPGLEQPVKWKMPYGYNVFHYAGTAIHDLMFDPRATTQGTAINFLTAVLNSWNPLQGADLLDTVIPTVGKPFEQSARNIDYKEAPIVPTYPFDQYDRPESQKAWKSTSSWLKGFTSWMNEVTGGDETHAGAIDISPETIKHYIKWIFGGAGATATQAITSTADLVTGEEVDTRNIPFVRTLFVSESARYDTERFYEAVKQVAAVEAQLKIYKGTENYSEYKADNSEVHKLAFHVRRYKNKIKKLRDKRDKAYADEDNELGRDYGEQIRQEMMVFSKRYDDAIEAQQ